MADLWRAIMEMNCPLNSALLAPIIFHIIIFTINLNWCWDGPPPLTSLYPFDLGVVEVS